jgi:RimJ/RimL family protein N-acetyltransferase
VIALKPFKIEDWKYLKKWISSESELIQFAGPIFTYPIDKKQVEIYLSDLNRTVFKVENEHKKTIGIAEINLEQENIAKLARILIGEKSMRGKGIGTELINKLIEYGFNTLKKEKIILNVYSWNVGAIKCYEKAGFYKTEKPIQIIKVGNEEWETIEMEKNQHATRLSHTK